MMLFNDGTFQVTEPFVEVHVLKPSLADLISGRTFITPWVFEYLASPNVRVYFKGEFLPRSYKNNHL